MKNPIVLSLPVVLAVATGCGLVKIQTSTSMGGVQSGGASAADVPAGTGDDRQAALYQDTAGITYKTVTADQLAITTLQSHYMMPRDRAYEPPPACGPNPDKEWIKTWPEDQQMTNPPVAAWIQSRLNKSYATDLDAAYAKYRGAWKTFDDALARKQEEALAKKSFYERLSALHTAFEEGQKEAAALPGGEHVVPGGLHRLVITMRSEYDREKVGWALMSSGTWTNEAIRRGLFQSLRPWGEEPIERKHFAALAMTGAVASLIKGLPVSEYVSNGGGGGTMVNDWLRWPEDVDLAQAGNFIQKADPELAPKSSTTSGAASYPMKTIEDMKSETKDAILAGAKKEEPKLAAIGGVVTAIAPDGDGVKVTLEMAVEYSRQNCVESGPITNISPDGYVHRKFSKCTIVERRETLRRFHLTAKAWPKEVDLGDWVDVTGDLESVAAKGTPKRSTVEVALTARFVGCFQKAEPLDSKARDYTEKLQGRSGNVQRSCSLATW